MMTNKVKNLQGNLKDKDFQDKLLDELNPRETKRLFSIVTELVADGHTNLYIIGEFKEHEKYIWVKDCDIPVAEDVWYSFDPSQLGGYWLSGAPSSWV